MAESTRQGHGRQPIGWLTFALIRPTIRHGPSPLRIGHKTESVYRRYAIVDEATMRESGVRLPSRHDLQGATGWTGGVSGVTGIANHSVRVPSESALTVERSR